MGDFEDLEIRKLDCNADCYLCDWECFRDPSELMGPILQGVREPLVLIQKFHRNPEYFQIWKNDLRYYRACDFFNGRKPMNASRLAKFSKKPGRGKILENDSQFRVYPSKNSGFCHSEQM